MVRCFVFMIQQNHKDAIEYVLAHKLYMHVSTHCPGMIHLSFLLIDEEWGHQNLFSSGVPYVISVQCGSFDSKSYDLT